MQNILFAGGIGIVSFSILSSLFFFLSKMKLKRSVPTLNKNTLPISRITLILGVLVFAIILFTFQNIVPALLAVIIIVLFPTQVTFLSQRKRKKEVLEQLGTAIKVFTNGYAVAPEVKTALQAAGNSTTGIVADIFNNAYYQLSLGRKLSSVLDDMGKQFGNSYGLLFTKLVKLADQKGTAILPLFHDLVFRVKIAQDNENFKYTQTTVDNYFNLILIIFPIFEYLLLLKFIPEVSIFMFETRIGSLIFTGWLISIIIWVMVDRLIAEY